MPERIRLSRAKGWRKPEGVIVVSRPSRWGNPFRIGRCWAAQCGPVAHWHVYDGRLETDNGWGPAVGMTDTEALARSFAVTRYRRWMLSSQGRIEDLVPLLRGRDLACWCPLDQPCHADVLLELANK